MFYFLPILGRQKVAMSDSAEGWCVALSLFPSHYPLIYFYFFPIFLVGRKLQCQTQHRDGVQSATSELPRCRSAGTTETDGQRTNDGTDDETDGWKRRPPKDDKTSDII